MFRLFLIFALAALISPLDAKSFEEFEVELNFLKNKIENLESEETLLKNKIENLERNEDNHKENEIKTRMKISEFEKKIDNLEMKLGTKITKTADEENLVKNTAEDLEYKLGNNQGNDTEERLSYLEELSKLQLRRNCQEMAEYGVTLDSFYYVDPDGPLVGAPPIRVWCHFNEDGQGVTEVLHNAEETISITHCHDAGCYVRPILYSAPDFQIQSLIQISEKCEQSIEYNCLLAPLEKEGVDLGFWLDKNGARQNYWDGANAGQHVCSCFFTEEGCLDHEVTGNTCNCDAGVPEMKSDVGVITNSSALPVSQLQFGGLSYEIQQASHRLGRLKCSGQAQYEAGTSCTAIKKAGEFRSGYFNVKKNQEENSQLVFCKASPGYNANNEDEVFVESSEDHFEDVETTIGEIETSIDGIETSIDGIETSIGGIKTDVSDVGGKVSTLEEHMDDVLMRSDYCSYQKGSWTADNTIITFQKLIVENNNIPGASMDIAKGEFTAGVTGIYDIDASMIFYHDSSVRNEVYFRLNGVNVAESYMLSGYTGNGYSFGMEGKHMKLLLNAGDILSLYGVSVRDIEYIVFCISLSK